MPISQEEMDYLQNLPNLRDVALPVSKKQTSSVSNEYLETFTIVKTYLTPNGVAFILRANSGNEYRYTPSLTEYADIRKIVMRGGKLNGRTLIMGFHQGSMGAGGAVYSPNVHVYINKINPLR